MVAKINEVAEAAGVSISTVSYALSGKRPVSPETRRRIEQAVSDLGYSPNAGARMLAGSRTHIFALTEPLRRDTHAPTHMSFVLATAVAARRSDYDVLLLTDEQASAGMARVAASGLVDAILVLDVAPDDERVDLARSIDTPSIFIGVPTTTRASSASTSTSRPPPCSPSIASPTPATVRSASSVSPRSRTRSRTSRRASAAPSSAGRPSAGSRMTSGSRATGCRTPR